jgi:hypothetical protein
MVDGSWRKSREKFRHIGGPNRDVSGKPVFICVKAGKRREFRLDLNANHLDAGDPRSEAEHRSPCARANFDHLLARFRWNRGGKKYRVGTRPSTCARLKQAKTSTEKHIFGYRQWNGSGI